MAVAFSPHGPPPNGCLASSPLQHSIIDDIKTVLLPDLKTQPQTLNATMTSDIKEADGAFLDDTPKYDALHALPADPDEGKSAQDKAKIVRTLTKPRARPS